MEAMGISHFETEANGWSAKIVPAPTKGRVLVMDDHPLARFFAHYLLRKMGYEVIPCSRGEEALEVYRNAQESGNPVSAVILDINVPGGMGGKETLRILRQMDPQVKAIVASGCHDDPAMTDFRRFGFSGALKKPFDTHELCKVVDTVVNGNGSKEALSQK